jgi:hypothetical protein
MKRTGTQHRFAADMLCANCGLGFSYRNEDCEGSTDAGRMELRRRIAQEAQAAADRKAREAAAYFAALKAKRARQSAPF